MSKTDKIFNVLWRQTVNIGLLLERAKWYSKAFFWTNKTKVGLPEMVPSEYRLGAKGVRLQDFWRINIPEMTGIKRTWKLKSEVGGYDIGKENITRNQIDWAFCRPLQRFWLFFLNEMKKPLMCFELCDRSSIFFWPPQVLHVQMPLHTCRQNMYTRK